MKRCPWCGKFINYPGDHRCVNQKKTPAYFRYAKCAHCDHYYGQPVYSSKVMRILLVSLIPVALFVFVLELYPILLIYMVAGLAVSFFMPYKRMDENEDMDMTEQGTLFQAKWTEEQKIKPHRFYFLTDTFDESAAFQVVSPIYFDLVNRKKHKGFGCFLYKHPQNVEYMERDSVDLYDSNMKYVGKIKFLHDSEN